MRLSPRAERRRRKNPQPDYSVPDRDSLSECLFALLELALFLLATGFVLQQLNAWYVSSRGAAVFAIHPDAVVWFAAPLFPGLIGLFVVHDWFKHFLFRVILRREMPGSWKPGTVSTVFPLRFVLPALFLTLAFCACLIPIHVRFTSSYVAEQRLWPGRESRHEYGEIAQISLAHARGRGGWSTERYLFIQFQDHSILTSEFLDAASSREVSRYLSAKTGLEVSYPPRGEWRCCYARPPR